MLNIQRIKHVSSRDFPRTGKCVDRKDQGGPYGKGKRMPISVTRTIIQGILNGNMSNYAYQSHEYTQLQIPVDMSGVSERIMFPEKGWDSIEEYKSKVSHLMELFELHRAQL